MARGNMMPARNCGTPVRFQTKAGQTAILAGEPVIQDTSSDVEYVQAPGANVTTSDTFVGVAATNDTVTATADGEVWVYLPAANSVFKGAAKTKANLATTVKNTKVVMDYTSPNYTIDESTTSSGFCLIVDYDAVSGEVEFMIDMTEAVNA